MRRLIAIACCLAGAAVVAGCDGQVPAAAPAQEQAAVATTPPGPVPTRNPSQVVLVAGDDPSWCGPAVTATILQPDPAALAAGEETALGQAAEVAGIAAGAALEPDVPEVVASFLRDTAALNDRVVQTRGQLTPDDDALRAAVEGSSAPSSEAVEAACDDTIAGTLGETG